MVLMVIYKISLKPFWNCNINAIVIVCQLFVTVAKHLRIDKV